MVIKHPKINSFNTLYKLVYIFVGSALPLAIIPHIWLRKDKNKLNKIISIYLLRAICFAFLSVIVWEFYFENLISISKQAFSEINLLVNFLDNKEHCNTSCSWFQFIA